MAYFVTALVNILVILYFIARHFYEPQYKEFFQWKYGREGCE